MPRYELKDIVKKRRYGVNERRKGRVKSFEGIRFRKKSLFTHLVSIYQDPDTPAPMD